MRAIVVRKFGATPELAEMPAPEPGRGAVGVQLAAAGVNPFDQRIASGFFDGKLPHDFPVILGVDGAGTVASVGPEVTRFAVGERVVGKFLNPPLGHGSFAEYAVIPEDGIITRIPPGVPTAAAAALPTAGITAQDIVTAAEIEPGQRVLIIGATGGVGSFLVQLANMAGAHVIATARTADADQMNRLGAAETVDYPQGPVAAQIRTRHPDGVDMVFDLVSPPATLAELTAIVRDGGTVFSTVSAADDGALRAREIKGGNLESSGRATELAHLLNRVAKGDVVVPIDATVPLDHAASVIGATGARGKTVLTI